MPRTPASDGQPSAHTPHPDQPVPDTGRVSDLADTGRVSDVAALADTGRVSDVAALADTGRVSDVAALADTAPTADAVPGDATRTTDSSAATPWYAVAPSASCAVGLGLLCALSLATGCNDGSTRPRDCSADGCEAAQNREQLLAAIADHADPIALFLRKRTSERGTLSGDYRDVLTGVGDELGCGAETERSFVVLSNTDLVPKTIFSRCNPDAQAASRFFLAIPSLSESGSSRDVEPGLLHLSAWDEDAHRYRHYATHPAEHGELRVSVKPSFCHRCHGGPEKLDYWQPLMNEMTNPWSQWVAEPGFSSQLFHEHLDPALRAAPVFGQLTTPARLGSASQLEPIIRAGIDRVTVARALGRDQAATLRDALDLLRPIFCDETINFVSEVHRSGELRASAIIDDGTRALMARAATGTSWTWLRPTMRMPIPAEGQPALSLVAVRGVSSEAVELALVTRGVLGEQELLRARALDWSHPVASAFRCDRYRRGRQRLERVPLTSWRLPPGADNTALAALLFRELLADITPPAGADLIAFERPDSPGAPLTVQAFGDVIERHFQTAVATGRAPLDRVRRERACQVAATFPTAPIFPDVTCAARAP